MRKLSFLLAAVVIVNSPSLAQQVLTKANTQIVLNDAFNVRVTNGVAPGGGGANQTWDLSGLNLLSSKQINVVLATTTPNHSNWPGSNMAFSETGGSYAYFNNSNDSLMFFGSSTTIPTSSTYILSNPQKLLQFPMSYNDAYTDTFSGTVNPGAVTQSGVLSVVYDGYGTLIRPLDTLYDVARVKLTSSYINQGSSSTDTFILTEYHWYMPGNHYPVAKIISTEWVGHGGPVLKGEYMMNVVLGVKESKLQDQISVYPNPGSDYIRVSIPKGMKGSVDLCITDMTRKVLGSMTIEESALGEYSMSVGSLPPGTYLISITSEDAVVVKRFVKM